MVKKLSDSFRREKLKKTSGIDTYKITPKMLKKLEQLAAMADDKIDLTDPEAPQVADWSNAIRGKFYRPIKKQITIRIDADVLDWFRHSSQKYQTLINNACREYMENHKKPKKILAGKHY